MAGRVLVVNAGSSSLKLRLLGADDAVEASADLPAGDADGLRRFVGERGTPDAVGHRIVHGGSRFRSSVLVTDEVRDDLAGLADLAPLHNPPALRLVDVVREVLPSLPAVACFDTAFHATIPDAAAVYAIPWAWTSELGVRRYGFHGLSHAWASRRAAQLVGRPLGDLRIVTCHLGSGASLAAVDGGRSVDTTMGFTPLEGLVMATRSGSVDPGALLWLQQRHGISAAEMEDALESRSGLLALSGTSGDMRDVEEARARGDDRASLGVAVYVHRLRAGIAAMVAAMGGVDVVVFTGGVGEHVPAVRVTACGGLAFLGVAVDDVANTDGSGDRVISPANAAVAVAVVGAREDVEIASEVRRLVG